MYECAACGFSFDLADAESVGRLIVERAQGVVLALRSTPAAMVRTRPDATTWSPLEYCCHLRDVLLVQRERVLLVRRTDRPTPEPMGRDERVEHDGYAAQDPEDVARQLEDAAALFANVLDRLDAGGLGAGARLHLSRGRGAEPAVGRRAHAPRARPPRRRHRRAARRRRHPPHVRLECVRVAPIDITWR